MNKAKRQSTERLRSWVPELRALAERSAKSFVRHDMAVNAMALAYRGLFALLPFAVFLIAVLSFLRVDAAFGWLAEQGPLGLRGRLPELIGWLESGGPGADTRRSPLGRYNPRLLAGHDGYPAPHEGLQRRLEAEETRPAWRRVASSLTLAPGSRLW
jgi:membrane protein